MIRRPSTFAALYRWWRDALAGKNPPRHDDDPRCGWYRVRRSRGGIWLPARIWCHQEIDPVTGELVADEYLQAEIEGIERSPFVVWERAEPISRVEFDRITDMPLRVPGMFAAPTFDLAAEPMRP